MERYLILDDGTVFKGEGFGAVVVFRAHGLVPVRAL